MIKKYKISSKFQWVHKEDKGMFVPISLAFWYEDGAFEATVILFNAVFSVQRELVRFQK